MKLFPLRFLIACGASFATLVGQAQSYTWTTIAGSPSAYGSADGTNDYARFNYPNGIALDSCGNLYVSDSGNDTIRKVSLEGTNWVVTTIAGKAGVRGSLDGTNSDARFSFQDGIVADPSGNLYVADYGNSIIRKVSPVGTNWVVVTLAGLPGVTGRIDGTNAAARFSGPIGIALAPQGNLAVAETFNESIRGLARQDTNWVVTTLAGRYPGSADGTNAAARFLSPYDIAGDSTGAFYVADADNFTIRRVAPVGTNWVVSTLSGLAGARGHVDGTNSNARFGRPTSLAVAQDGTIFVADGDSHTVRKLTASGTNWVVSTIGGMPGEAGTADGTGTSARFMNLQAIAVDGTGNLYVADADANTIRLGSFVPSLQAFISGRRLTLSWPALASKHVLETSSSLSEDNEWTPVTQGCSTNASVIVFTTDLDAGSAFYRLRKQ
jgi:sugar lactone lactonase YvrE